jgi:heptaprenyl diphosphate synthase
VRIIAETFAELVTGQMRETRGPRPGDDLVEHYLTVIAKTGSLIATSGRYGGMFSGCTPDQVESLHRFGAAIGTAFQISDDIIDITSLSPARARPRHGPARGCAHPADALRPAGHWRARLPTGSGCPRPPDHGRCRGGRGPDGLRPAPGVARAEEVLAEHASAACASWRSPDCSAATALASLTTLRRGAHR